MLIFINIEKKESCEQGMAERFHSVIVRDLKDSSNYYKFINNWSPFMAKIQRDKLWVQQKKNKRTLSFAQNKIDGKIKIDFTEALQDMEEGK